MAKQLLFDDRARIKLQRGVETLASAVAVTMGPTGRNVIIDKSFGNPVVTKDGVTVSKEVELEDPYEHMGAKLVNQRHGWRRHDNRNRAGSRHLQRRSAKHFSGCQPDGCPKGNRAGC